MNKIEVQVFGKKYPVRSSLDEKTLMRTLECFQNELSVASKEEGAIGREEALLLTALRLAEAVIQAQEETRFLNELLDDNGFTNKS